MRRVVTVASVAVAFCMSVASASALTLNGVAATTYANGFAHWTSQSGSPGLGPVGVAFDSANNLYAADPADGWLYRFSGPGQASAATRLGPAPVGGAPRGLAFDVHGHLYVARKVTGDVVQVDPSSGAIVRTVATKLGCPVGLADDAATGDLFVSDFCGGRILRILSPQSAAPTVTAFVSGLHNPDGLTAASDGSLYSLDSGKVIRIAGAGSGTPGQVAVLANVPEADGIAIGGYSAGAPSYLLINRNDGILTRVDLSGSTAKQTDLFTGGSRGDLVAVGFDGCVYATQSDRILKVTNADGGCMTPAATAAGIGGVLQPTTVATAHSGGGQAALSPKGHCVDSRHFRFVLHHSRATRVVAVSVFVNGKRKMFRTGANLQGLTIRPLPQSGSYVVRIVAVQSNGVALITTRTYRTCTKTRPRTQVKHVHRTRHSRRR